MIKLVLLLVLYGGAACCVYFTLWKSASFVFGVSSTSIGDRMGNIIPGGDLGFNYWIGLSKIGVGLSTLGHGLIIFYNGDSCWVIVFFLFIWYSVPTFLFLSRYVGSGVVWMWSMVVFPWIFSTGTPILVWMIPLCGAAFSFWVCLLGLRLLQWRRIIYWRLGLWYIFDWKILSLELLLRVSHLPISSNIGSFQSMCLVHIPFCSALQFFSFVVFVWIKASIPMATNGIAL